MSDLKLLVFLAVVTFFLYNAFIKTDSWLDQIIDLMKRSMVGKIILWVIGICLVLFLILIKAAF